MICDPDAIKNRWQTQDTHHQAMPDFHDPKQKLKISAMKERKLSN
jgi:hypothetical protein